MTLWTLTTKNLSSNYSITCTSCVDSAALQSVASVLSLADHVVVISDTNIARLPKYTATIDLLRQHFVSKNISDFQITPGEMSKSQTTADEIIAHLVQVGCTRKSVLIALGGGVVGDLVGYTAGIFLRGIPFIQFPTSVLAMIDSSVGGKTAVDLAVGKNLVGVFKQPAGVVIDLGWLDSLPERQLCNGIAEAIKVAVVSKNKRLWTLLEKFEVAARIPRFLPDLSLLVQLCIQYKLSLVEQDEFDTKNLRTGLNFGHTIGHALETAVENFLHGEAVAVGMVIEAMAIGNYYLAKRIANLNHKFNLPGKVATTIPLDAVFSAMRKDKKKVSGKFPITGIPEESSFHEVDEASLRRLMAPMVQVGGISGDSEIHVELPGSKSLSNRALVLGALSVLQGEGPCVIGNFTATEDTTVMLEALKTLGWQLNLTDDLRQITISDWSVPEIDVSLFVENAGTAARFLLPVAALVAVRANLSSIRLDGNCRMRQRPIGPLVTALSELFGEFLTFTFEGVDCLPVLIKRRNKISDVKKFPLQVLIDGAISSQFVTGILLIAPSMARETCSNFRVHVSSMDATTGLSTSQPYIDMTLSLLRQFRVEATVEKGTITFASSSRLRPPQPSFIVPGDASAASYILAMAAVAGRAASVNVASDCMQGDFAFVHFLEKLGCSVELSSTRTIVHPIVKKPLGNLTLDFSDITDTFLTAAAVLAVVLDEGESVSICNIENQRVKECDRIAVLCTNFALLGLRVTEYPDGLTVFGFGLSQRQQVIHIASGALRIFDVAGDHRMAMSSAVLAVGLSRKYPRTPILIPDPLCVQKTFPTFWEILVQNCGVDVQGVDLQQPYANVTCIVGMRGIGKSTMAKSLTDYTILDLDERITVHLAGESIQAFVANEGWDKFRALEYDKLVEALSMRNNLVII